MFVPKLFISISDISSITTLEAEAKKKPLAVFFKNLENDRQIGIEIAQAAKKICLHLGIALLVDDVEIAALVNADGVICTIDDDMQGRAKDILGEDKLVGGTAHTIQDVATLFEEGMTDFLMLTSYTDIDGTENILGKQKSQSIIDDARIMGYNIPILLAGGINSANAEDALSTGAYGIMTSDLNCLKH